MIESPKNQRIKDLIKLREGKNRRKLGLFTLEGDREIERALASSFKINEVFVCESRLSSLGASILSQVDKSPIFVSEQVFQKIALRESVGGIVATAFPKEYSLSDLEHSDSPFLIVVESVEKPGNLGAILRTADGVGADAVVVLDPKADVFNPNSIRSSLGAAFSVPTIVCDTDQFLSFSQSNKIQLVAASPHSDKSYTAVNYKVGTAIILGSEAHGLSDVWEDSSNTVKIPMLGVCDSLNVSVSAAILAYEVLRQRS